MERKLKILVVDDAPSIAMLLKIVFGRGGHEVTSASDGHAALQLLQSTQFDLISTEYQMPGMNGLELIRAIRSSNSSTPIVVCTSETEVIDSCLDAGANTYMEKPPSLAEVKRILSELGQGKEGSSTL